MVIRKDLSKLSHAERVALNHELYDKLEKAEEKIAKFEDFVARLEKCIEDLEGRLALNRRNSSKPPSSDFIRQPARPRSKGAKKQGGQQGHKGAGLLRVAEDQLAHIVEHQLPASCEGCGRKLPTPTSSDTQGRQVIDLPALAFEVVEHRVLSSTCSCGQVHLGKFPSGVNVPVQYGRRVKAAAVLLNSDHMVPMARTADILRTISGLSLCSASVKALVAEAGILASPIVESIAELCSRSKRAGADETGGKVAGVLHWVHVFATKNLTHIAPHEKRGMEAFASIGILERFEGVLTHEGWKPYRGLACEHSLCNAHHARE